MTLIEFFWLRKLMTALPVITIQAKRFAKNNEILTTST